MKLVFMKLLEEMIEYIRFTWKSSVEFNEVEFNEEAWLSNFRGVLGVLGVLIKAGRTNLSEFGVEPSKLGVAEI